MAEEILAEEENIEEKNTSFVKIDPVILTPEVVDNFRLQFEDPSEALARDLVKTMQVDYAKEMEKDPNFLTYEGLISGTSPFLDRLPSTQDKSPMERAFTADQAVILFSNAQPASFARPFLSEFFKSGASTEVMATTARAVGPRLIPSAVTAGSAVAGPPGAVAGFGAGVVGTGALSLLAGGATYLLGDYLEEQVMGPDEVITPGQRAEYEAYRTLGGGTGAIRFPWLMSTEANLAGQFMFQNIAKDAVDSRALGLLSGLDKIISSTGSSARKNAKMTVAGELAGASGSSMGAYIAESMDPGATGTRLASELVGGNLLYATLLKTMPRILNSEAVEDVGGVAVSTKQKQLFTKINELYENYGTPEQYDQLQENLTSPEMTQMLQDTFPDVDFTAAQRGRDPLLMGIEATKALGEPRLDMARKKAERQSMQFMNDFIKGLISEGDPENVRKAAKLRVSLFDDILRAGLEGKMDTFLKANETLSNQPGQSSTRSQQELSEQLYDMVGDYITAASNKERELWKAVPNVDVIGPMTPDTDVADLPAFLRVFDEISYEDPSVQKDFAKSSPILFNFIESSREELGLNPKPILSNPEIESLDKYKKIFDNSVTKLAGFEAEKDIVEILNKANDLPVSARASFLRKRQQEIKETLKHLAYPEDSKRLAVSLDKAADYAGVKATIEARAIQRAGEPREEGSALTSNRLSEVRSKLLRTARSLAASPETSDEARRIGLVAEAIAEDLDIDGLGEAGDVARAYTRAKHDFFSRTIVGQIGQSQRSGAAKLPAEVTFETFIKTNPSITLSRIRQLQGMAEFADAQNLPSYLPENAITGSDTVFTTTSNLIDSYLRSLKQVASKEVFDPKTNTTRTVIDATGLNGWKEQNAEILKNFPQLNIDLASASSAQRAVEVMEQGVKEARKIANSQTALSNLIGGMSPTQAVADAFNSKTPVKAFRNLFALRRMGTNDGPMPKTRFDADQTIESRVRGLKNTRDARIIETGLNTSEINNSLSRAVLEHAYLAAGGEGSFNPQVFYKTLFQKMPKADQSLMDVSEQFNIFPEKTRNRIKFMSEQLMSVQAADAAGLLNDPDYVASAGPIIEFYIGVLGSAAGTQAFRAAGGSGPGAISASGVGARQLRKIFLELPQVANLRLIDMVFTDAPLTAALMQRPGTEKAKESQYKKIIKMLNDKIFNTSISMSPYLIREAFEEEDRGTDSILAEDPKEEIPALRERLQNQSNSAQPQPPAQEVTQLQGPKPPPTPAPAPVAPTTAPNTGSVDRSRFAAMFPNDIASGLINQGIGSIPA